MADKDRKRKFTAQNYAMKHINATITGKVQGVFYRDSTRQKCQELGVNGFVKNQTDGSVYLEAEGTAQQLDELIAWCEQGPEKAQVEDITITESEEVGFKDFEIRY